ESLNWNPETVKKMKDQGSLSHLITTSERIKRDALLLMERSDESTDVPSATLETAVRLKNQEERQAFVQEYVQMVKKLVE
ncbi:hypothetical protein MXD62_09560, partial [Frankia sp. Mgl5]